MEVQSVLFDNKIYNTGMARLFLKRHLLVPIKLPDKTTNTYRFRIREPSYRHYKTVQISIGVKIVYGYN